MNSADRSQLTKFPAGRGKKRRSARAWLAVGALGLACSGRCNDTVRQDPHAAESARSIDDARLAYVTNNGSDSLSLLDLDTPGRVLDVRLDFDDRREAPHHLAVTPDRLFVALAHPRLAPPAGGHKEHGRSADTPGEIAVLDRHDLRLLARLTVDESPGDLLVTRAGDRLLVTHYDLARAFVGAARNAPPRELFASLQVWDTRTLTLWAARDLCVAPHGIAVSGDGATAYVACYGSDELAVVDLRTRELSADKIPLGSRPGPLGAPEYGPYAAVLTPDERQVLVSQLEGKALAVFDVATRRFTDSLALRARAMLPCVKSEGARTVAFVPLVPDGLERLERSQQGDSWVEVTRRDLRHECVNPHAAVCRADGRVWLICEGDHQTPGLVLEVDAESLDVRARYPVGVYPDGMGFAR